MYDMCLKGFEVKEVEYRRIRERARHRCRGSGSWQDSFSLMMMSVSWLIDVDGLRCTFLKPSRQSPASDGVSQQSVLHINILSTTLSIPWPTSDQESLGRVLGSGRTTPVRVRQVSFILWLETTTDWESARARLESPLETSTNLASLL